MEGDPDRFERVVGRSTAERFRRLIAVEAELAAGGPRGQILVAAALDVRVQPDGNRCSPAEGARRGRDLVELFDRLDVERADPDLDGRVDLVLALPDPREGDLGRGYACLRGLGEFASGDDVGAEILRRDDVEEGERVVGLDRVARQVRDAFDCRLEGADPLAKGIEVVRVERRPDLGGDFGEIAQG